MSEKDANYKPGELVTMAWRKKLGVVLVIEKLYDGFVIVLSTEGKINILEGLFDEIIYKLGDNHQ